MARFVAIVLVVCLPVTHLFSQSNTHDFRPNALGVGLGGSLVVQARDPSAIFWNPALLSGLKYRGMLISINEPFGFDFVGITQYVPLFGTIGAAFTRMSDSTRTIDGGTVAWGRKLFHGVSIGTNFTMSKQGDTPAASLGFGMVLGNPQVGSLEAPPTKGSSLLDQLKLGVTVQGLPLSRKLFDPSILFGFSYWLPGSRVLLNTGYHLQTPQNSLHTGLGLRLFDHLTLFAGAEDFELDRVGVGASYLLHNFWVNLSYAYALKRLLLTFSVRISPEARDLAAPYYDRGRAHFTAGNDELATSELRKYLSYDLREAKRDTASSIVRYLEQKLTKKRIKIDSLFAQAQRFMEQPKPQTLRAAYNYTRILELDQNNLKARIKLTALKPRVDRYLKRWLADGIYEYESGNYEKATIQFKKVLLFKKKNSLALNYLDKIDQFYRNLSQELFFRGVGFLANKKYDVAIEQFNRALKYNPDMQDARRYLKITDQRIREREANIKSLLKRGQTFERQKRYRQAIAAYKDVLLLDEANSRAKAEIQKLETKVAHQRRSLARKRRQAASYFSQAEEAFQKGEWQKAFDLDSAGLAIIPDDPKAVERRKKSQQRLQARSFLAMGQVDLNAENYLAALRNFQKASERDSQNVEVQIYLRRAKSRIDELVKRHFDEGINLYTQDKYHEAIARWNRVLELDPEHEGSKEYITQAQERIEALRAIKK